MKAKYKRIYKNSILENMKNSKIYKWDKGLTSNGIENDNLKDFKNIYFNQLFWNEWVDLISELKHEGFLDKEGCINAKGILFIRNKGYTITYNIKSFLKKMFN